MSILDHRYQVIWAQSFEEWALGFVRFEPPSSLATVYVWALIVGPLEIRRWTKDEEPPGAVCGKGWERRG